MNVLLLGFCFLFSLQGLCGLCFIGGQCDLWSCKESSSELGVGLLAAGVAFGQLGISILRLVWPAPEQQVPACLCRSDSRAWQQGWTGRGYQQLGFLPDYKIAKLFISPYVQFYIIANAHISVAY